MGQGQDKAKSRFMASYRAIVTQVSLGVPLEDPGLDVPIGDDVDVVVDGFQRAQNKTKAQQQFSHLQTRRSILGSDGLMRKS